MLLNKALLAFGLLAAPLGVALAQPVQQVQARGGLNPDSFYGKESFQGVSVRDSLEAIKKLEDARRMERLEDWNKAADWYQEVIEKYGQYVIPSGLDKEQRQSQYKGIEAPVQEQLAKWPKAGLDAYRNRYGAVAATMLEQARQDDRETLSKVMKLYFITEAGKQAGIRLVDLLLESGEFAEASRVGDRLLEWHPNLVVERPKMLFRTALAYHLSGAAAKAKERADQLKTKHAGAVGTLFGKDVVLTDALDRLLQVSPPVTVAASSGSVRYNPGGDESRSMISAAKAHPGARLASIDYSPPPVARSQGQQGQEMEVLGRRDRDAGLAILPVADDGELFFQDGSRVYAVSLQSGVPLPGWMQSYPNTNGQYTINAYGVARNVQFTLALTDAAVLGIMGYSDRLAAYGVPVYGSDRGTRLVCLDRATGKERWSARPSKIAEENLRALDFSGSPLVVGDNVYVMGRGGKNYTSEDCYVLCFDLNTGNYKWSCFIASCNNAMAFNGQMSGGDTLSHMAYSSGRIYVLTNVGAMAALDAYSGTISWLNIYPREAAMMDPNMGWRGMGIRGGGMGGNGNIRPWEFNAVIVQDGKVFILPTDSKNILVYDAGSGNEIKRIPLSNIHITVADDTGGPQSLVAVQGNHLFLTSDKGAYCVDWTKPPERDQCIFWHESYGSSIKGRAFVTADSMFLTTESQAQSGKAPRGGLYRIAIATGKGAESYPSNKDWDEGEGPGNVLVIGDQVIIAGAKRINVYADMALARKRLDDDVAAAPTSPEPRLRYAEVMFVAGQLPVAMEKLNETVKLLGGLKSMRPGPERDHFFNDCLTFAIKLQKDKRSETMDETVQAITQLYDLAAQSADSDSQQVNYRMSRGKFDRDFVQEDSLAQAVDLYQQILDNQRLRIVPLIDEEAAGTTQAAIVAERMINEVKKAKPQAYEKYEKMAADALVDAGSDPAMLKSVADTYPNSGAAYKAMTTAAAAYEAQSNHRLAAHTLRQVYNKYGEQADRPRLLEDMARNYLAMPDRTPERVDTAAARLSTIVKLGAAANTIAKPLKLPGEQVLVESGVSVNDALKAVQNYKAQAISAKLPDFHVPGRQTEEQRKAWTKALAAWQEQADAAEAANKKPPPKPRLNPPFVDASKQLVIPAIDALIKPPLYLRPLSARQDRVVAWSNNNVVIYPVGSDKPIGNSAELSAQPKNLAWLDRNGGLLIWSDSEILLLDGSNGQKKWNKIQLKTLPRIDVVAGGAATDETVSNANANGENEVIINNFNRRRFIRGGLVINPMQPQAAGVPAGAGAPVAGGAEAIAQVIPVDDKIIVATSAGQLFAIQIANGSLAWHTRLSAAGAISRLAANDDFTVAKVDDAASTQLVALDTLTGQLVKRMTFANESGNVPVNVALAPDGTMVWIQQDRLCGKDLFEPRKEPNYEIVAGQGDAAGANGRINANIQVDGQVFSPIYAGAVNPDQLLISEGRILVVTHTGRFVSLHSLETGKLLDYQADGKRAEARLATVHGEATRPVNDWGVGLHLVGSKLYVCTRENGPVAYNLDKAGPLWGGSLDNNTSSNLQYDEPFIGQDHLVLIDRPISKTPVAAAAAAPGAPGVLNRGPNINPAAAPNAAAANAPAAGTNTIRLYCYARSVDAESGHESGTVDHFPYVRDDNGIREIQGVDGGFYYLTGDKKLYFLKGSRP